MPASYVFTPGIWLSVLTVFLMICLAIYSGRRRTVPGARMFALGCWFAAAWTAGAFLEKAALHLETKIFWFKVQGSLQLPIVIATTCFILEYAWPGRWLTRRNLVLLWSPCLLFLLLTPTNGLHHLAWRGFAYNGDIVPLRGPLNWVMALYGYGLTLLSFFIFAWLFRRSPQHRWPVLIMVAGQLAGRGLYALEMLGYLPSALPYNIPPVVVEYLMYAIALFGFHILDPLPLARRAVIEQIHAGALVLDTRGHIVGINPSLAKSSGYPPAPSET